MEKHHKFKVGDVVYEITRPKQLLLVNKRNGIIYSCKPFNERGEELIYMERDLRKVSHDLVLRLL